MCFPAYFICQTIDSAKITELVPYFFAKQSYEVGHVSSVNVALILEMGGAR